MRRLQLFAFLAAALLPIFAVAIPARKAIYNIPDSLGNILSVTKMGDESASWFQSADGQRFSIDSRRCLIPFSPQTPQTPRKLPGKYSSSDFPTSGSPRGIAILVEYSDVKFSIDNPLDYFSRLLNQPGFDSAFATGSARDWFIDNSNGIFSPSFDVFGPVQLQNPRAYYGANNAFGSDIAPHKMAIEACSQINPDVDFSIYDGDNDGKIDNVFIFYAGRGENSSEETDAVWPHAWYVSSAQLGANYFFDYVKLDRYSCANELEPSDFPDRGVGPVGIGPFVHEFCHVLGLPDFYPTVASSSKTMGQWSIMDYGPYLNDTHTPPFLSSYERSALGWGEPLELPLDPQIISLDPRAEGDPGYKHAISDSEFFVFENRQLINWDAFLPAHGLVVWHINYNPATWDANGPNNDPENQGVALVPADNLAGYPDLSAITFPGTTNNTSLGPLSSPPLLSRAGLDVGIDLSFITEIDSRVVMALNGADPLISQLRPLALPADKITHDSFRALWADFSTTFPDVCEYRLFIEKLIPDSDPQQFIPLENNFPRQVNLDLDATIDGLEPESTYRYFIVALDADGLSSLPSQNILVSTTKLVGLNSQIVAPDNNIVAVFDLCGRPIPKPSASGIYLLKYADGSVAKSLFIP